LLDQKRAAETIFLYCCLSSTSKDEAAFTCTARSRRWLEEDQGAHRTVLYLQWPERFKCLKIPDNTVLKCFLKENTAEYRIGQYIIHTGKNILNRELVLLTLFFTPSNGQLKNL